MTIQRGDPSQHRLQGIVERFDRTLSDRLFSYQYHKELEDPSKSNREWVSRLDSFNPPKSTERNYSMLASDIFMNPVN